AELGILLRDYLLAPGDKERARTLATFRATETKLNQLLDQYADKLISDERDRRLLGEFRNVLGQWIAEANKVMALLAAGERQKALDRAFETLVPLGDRTHKTAGEWVEHNERLAREGSTTTVDATRDARWKWWLASALAVVLTVALGFWT